MSVYVVDASVAAKWFSGEEHADAALRLRSGPHELHAPDFFLLEMDNVVCKWIRRRLITEPEGDAVRARLDGLPIARHTFMPLRNAAYALATQTARSVYDCLYLALAERLGAQMVTADRRLYDAIAAGPFGGYIVWIEDVQ